MGLFRLPGRISDRPVVDEDPTPKDVETTEKTNKENNATDVVDSASEPDDSSTDYQRGDEAIRAMTQAWSRKHLIIAYIL
jgi:hypothetical protein